MPNLSLAAITGVAEIKPVTMPITNKFDREKGGRFIALLHVNEYDEISNLRKAGRIT